MRKFPDDETEFQLQWTAQGEKVALLGGVVATINARAADAFTRRRDDVANSLRDLSQHFHKLEQEAGIVLQEFIAEDRRRDYEFKTKVKAPRPVFEVKRTVRP